MSVLANSPSTLVTHRNQLVEYFSSAEKPKSEWLIGNEHEMFAYRLSTLQPVSYDELGGLKSFLQAMREFGWQPVMEGDNMIGLTRGRSNVSFEPGGQVELAAAPHATLHEVAAEIDQFLLEACSIADICGIGFLGMGFHPTMRRDDVPWVPKNRYSIMRAYMPKRGTMGLDMMGRTCTVQVNLDFASEQDMVSKFRTALALQPIATAIFASSPLVEGKPSGFNSYRMHVWSDVDPDRTGSLPIVFQDGFGYERYTDYALDVPMYFVYRDGNYIDCTGQSFRAFMEGRLPALPGEIPTLNDWANHLTTIFPDVRMKKILEMRGADCGSREMLLALPSFWTGILYDATAHASAWDMVKGWTTENHTQLRADVARHGLQAKVRGQSVADIAQRAITLAQQGLRRRVNRLHGGADETRYLDILFNISESQENAADNILAHLENNPGYSLADVFAANRLTPPAEASPEEPEDQGG